MDNDLIMIDSDNNNTKVKDRLNVFVKYFVEQFETKLIFLHLILEGELKKAGKISNTFSKIVGQATGALLGLILASPGKGAEIGGAAAEKLASKIGSEQYRKKVANLEDLVDRFLKDKTKFRRSLVEVGVDIFQSFESQFMKLTTDLGPKQAMKLLAIDATNRAMNYYIDNKDPCLTKGIILGESKIEPVCGVPIVSSKIKTPGFEVIYKYGSVTKKWSTANLYETVGLVLDGDASRKGVSYYEKKDGKSEVGKYGYRRLFSSENWNQLKNQYKSSNLIKSGHFTDHQYILGTKEIKENIESILNKINLEDKNLTEERINGKLQELQDDVRNIYVFFKKQNNSSEEYGKILENIESIVKSFNSDVYLNKFKQLFEDAKQERQEIAKANEEGRKENRDGQSKILGKLSQMDKKIDNLLPQKTQTDGSSSDLLATKYYYITRILGRNIQIKEDFKNETSKFFVTSSGHVDKLKLQNSQDIVLISNKRTDFETLSNEHNRLNIHWLKDQDNKFEWQHSQGSLTRLRNYVDNTIVTSWKVQKISDIKDKLVIISAGPGMGKSTLLSHLAFEQQKARICDKVIRVNLNNHSDKLSKADFKNKNGIIKFLREITEIKDLESSFLLFDGFDEIASDPYYKGKVIKLINFLKDEVKQMWITTRPFAQYDLEDALSVFSYTLEPLTEENQKEFLEIFWKTNFMYDVIKELTDKIGSADEDELSLSMAEKASQIIDLEIVELKDDKDYNLNKIRSIISRLNPAEIKESVEKITNLIDKQQGKHHTIPENLKDIVKKVVISPNLDDIKDLIQKRAKSYAAELIAKFSKSVSDKEREFTGVPLQIRMLAEAFQQEFYEDFIKFYNLEPYPRSRLNDKPKLPDRLNLLDLYERFIENKRKINFVEKGKMDLTNLMAKKHFNDSRMPFVENHRLLALNLIFSKEDWTFFFEDEDKNKIKKLNEDIGQGEENTGIVYQIINGKPRFIHRTFAEYFAADFFVNNMLKKSEDNLKYEQVRDFLRKNIFNKRNEVIRDFFDRMLAKDKRQNQIEIHTAVLNNDKDKVIELLSDSQKAKNIINSLDKGNRTALHLAAAYDHLDIVKVLLEYEASICTRDKIFGWSPLSYADKGHYWGVAELLLEKEASWEDMFEAKKNVNTLTHIDGSLLHIAAKEGYIYFAEVLVDKLNANLYAAYVLNMIPLHYAAERGKLNVVKFLLNKDRDAVNIKDKINRTPLHLAVDGGHIEVVRYIGEILGLNKMEFNQYILNTAASNTKHSKYVANLLKDDLDVNYKMGDWSPIHRAAKTGSLELVKILVENGADIISADNNGMTPLHRAATGGHYKVVKYLVQELKSINADINPADYNGFTPLHKVIEYGDYDLVKYLVQVLKSINADINPADNNGCTPLHKSIDYGHYDISKYLLQELKRIKANINPADNTGRTLLHIAAIRGHYHLVKYLVEELKSLKADINPTTHLGITPIHFAVDGGHLDAVRYLGEKSGFNKLELNGYILNTVASNTKYYKDVATLLKEDVDVNSKVGDWSPIHRSVETGSLELVKLLVENGADIISADNYGLTPLHWALYCGNQKLVKYLVQELKSIKADINPADNRGLTVLHLAFQRGKYDIVRYLVQELKIIKADINPSDNSGETPLHWAAISGHCDLVEYIVEELISIKADINPTAHDGRTPIHLAVGIGFLEIVRYLGEKSGFNKKELNEYLLSTYSAVSNPKYYKEVATLLKEDVDVNSKVGGLSPIHRAAKASSLELVQLLVENGADIISADEDGMTPLHSAATHGQYEVVEYLVQELKSINADINPADNKGCTPLHCAIKGGELILVKYFIEQIGEEICYKNDNLGITPLHVAAFHGRYDIVEYLVREKANINAIDERGRTVVFCAVCSNNNKVINFLLNRNAIIDSNDGVSELGLTVLHVASMCGEFKIVKDLVKKYSIDVNGGENSLSPLHLAAISGNSQVIKYLIDKGANFDAKVHFPNVVKVLKENLFVRGILPEDALFNYKINKLLALFDDDPNDFEGLTPSFIYQLLGYKDKETLALLQQG